MTIGTKLTLWYSTVILLTVAIVGAAMYFELVIEPESFRREGLPQESVRQEIGEVVFIYALPAMFLTIAGGWLLTRKALAPVARISEAVSTIGAQELSRTRLTRSHNGDELDRLAAIFNSMLQRLEESFVREREFTLHASHELKTPLAVMRAQIETALRETKLTDEQREVLGAHLEEIVRCAGIVDSLAFLAKADAGQLRLESSIVDFDDLVRESFDDAQTLGLSKSLSVKLARCESVKVRGDAHRLRQLLLNLCDNAVKHNVEKGSIAISTYPAGDWGELLIENTGPALGPEQLSRLFDRFYRADPSHDPNTEGSGLGLSIVQSIVKAHRGEIAITSKDSVTSVRVRLPRAHEAFPKPTTRNFVKAE